MPSFMLRSINPVLWSAVKAKAQHENISVKQAVLHALKLWAGLLATEKGDIA